MPSDRGRNDLVMCLSLFNLHKLRSSQRPLLLIVNDNHHAPFETVAGVLEPSPVLDDDDDDDDHHCHLPSSPCQSTMPA